MEGRLSIVNTLMALVQGELGHPAATTWFEYSTSMVIPFDLQERRQSDGAIGIVELHLQEEQPRPGIDETIELEVQVLPEEASTLLSGAGLAGQKDHASIDQVTVSQQFIAEDFHLFLALLTFADDITAVMVGKAWLNAI